MDKVILFIFLVVGSLLALITALVSNVFFPHTPLYIIGCIVFGIFDILLVVFGYLWIRKVQKESRAESLSPSIH